MKVTTNKPFLVEYNGYKIEIYKHANGYAYWVRGCNINDSQGRFTTPKEALQAAKILIEVEK